MRDTRRSRLVRSLGALAAAAAMAMASPGAEASGAPEATAGSKDVLAEAGELFRAGQEHFEATRFDDAIELWTRAHDLLPDEPEYRANRSFVAASLAQAHVAAHGVDGDIEHLRRADELYEEYLAQLDPADTQTRQTIEAERGRIQEILAREAPPPEEPPQDAEPDQDEADEVPSAPATPEAGPPSAGPAATGIPPFTLWERRMTIAGGVNLILGVALTGAAGSLFALRNRAEREGASLARDPTRSASELRVKGESVLLIDRLALTNLAFAGLFGAVGIGLTAAAIDRRVRRLRSGARVVPSVGPRVTGATLTGRF